MTYMPNVFFHKTTPYRLLVLSLLCLLTIPIHAHPGDGLDIDSAGNIYFTDVYRKIIWRVDPQGALTPVLEHRWAHGLSVDSLDRIWVEVEEANTSYSIVRIESDGAETTVVGPSPRGLQLYGVNILGDGEGNLYFPHSDPPKFYALGIRRRSAGGSVSLLAGSDTPGHRDGRGASALFSGLQAMRFASDGWIYVVDQDSVRRVSRAGQVETLYRGIRLKAPKNQPFDNGNDSVSNRIYGLAVKLDSGEVLVAYHGNRSVVSLSEMGRKVVYRSKPPWAPVGVVLKGDSIVIKETGLEPGSNRFGPRIVLLDPGDEARQLVEVESELQ